jgi:ABC-type proline/glycine betaine transport system permease subunit
MLIAMIGIALFAAVIGAGANGSPLAYGMAVSLAMLSIYFITFAAIYWSSWFVLGFFRHKTNDAQAVETPEAEATS